MEHIRSVLDENGWDFKKASRVLEISDKRLLRDARSFVGQAIAGRQRGWERSERILHREKKTFTQEVRGLTRAAPVGPALRANSMHGHAVLAGWHGYCCP
ncbi:MAG TPA: hypothetical protein VLW86_12800 [Syntrophorhabdales bacterium]|nr:hypothetical protein [Syntrophorhabdales bacterium]